MRYKNQEEENSVLRWNSFEYLTLLLLPCNELFSRFASLLCLLGFLLIYCFNLLQTEFLAPIYQTPLMALKREFCKSWPLHCSKFFLQQVIQDFDTSLKQFLHRLFRVLTLGWNCLWNAINFSKLDLTKKGLISLSCFFYYIKSAWCWHTTSW